MVDILKSIAHCNDQKILHGAIAASRKRLQILAKRNYENKLAAIWDEAKTWKPGEAVYCNTEGLFIGSKVQRGTRATIILVQPRARRVWMDVNGNSIGFGLASLERYDWRKTVPNNPVSDSDRKLANDIGNTLATIINKS